MEWQSWRDSFTDAIRFWEPRRAIYNAVLATIVLAYFAVGYPASKEYVSVNGILLLFLLAVLANVAYCAAYVVDLFVQASGFRDAWRRNRWVLFVIGLLFAGALTRFWSMAIFTEAGK